ncbi:MULTISPECIES: Na+/H+ antiporter subunit E [unclassified Paenibacillus]|uniref:Na+/H+ antiporter subunit E n=1 Tax=unclassified Paenibacillus TaxID=185978 RepID=UPI00091A0FB1|nr:MULTISPECIES: Na+/H+ antiporter subunit E [unclassified Paenibacillus]SHN54947.1 multicomponent Na+:H+ antiporter subunit E [Paenibacillus sp. ov031]SLJ95921.1 multisubunit sodium/proton antiporter, MrpE subunit [Paenibacillus sp. RU5A]SOC67218.1 multisubunit sodium/proton antiporter, MrpE subunit [Paenibacillus sp. RU26A]SOC69506.1 multisubunit sodium/proton antiporter, MrpE subunit [Paenibacillus sp. RU5M]
MAFQIVLNLIIAFVWMFLNNEWNGVGFLTGYLLGLLLIGSMRRFFPQRFYIVRVWAIIKLIALLFKELVRASIEVIRQIVKPKLDIRPGIFTYQTQLSSDWEVTLLCLLISLTPGSLPLEISGNQRKLFIHALDIKDEQKMSDDIKNTFEKAIMEVTR